MNKKFHEIVVLQTDEDHLYLAIDSKTYRFRWTDCSPRLANATPEQRQHMDISPSGYGIHWPLLDEDLAIDPLIKAVGEPVELPMTR